MAEASFHHIACREEGGVAVVTFLDTQVQGEEAGEALRRELHAAAAATPCRKWVLDFQNVSYFGSAGIRPLMSLHRKVQSSGGRIVLCQVKEQLREVFQVTRLVSNEASPAAPFELASDKDDALRKLKHHVRQVEDGVLVFTFTDRELHGDDLASDLLDEMNAALAEAGTDRIVLDFSRIEMISTPCMRPMLVLRTQLKERGGRIAISCLSPDVAEIFTVTRLIAPRADTPGLFEAFPDNAAAVKALKK